jgi:hypothetical protein
MEGEHIIIEGCDLQYLGRLELYHLDFFSNFAKNNNGLPILLLCIYSFRLLAESQVNYLILVAPIYSSPRNQIKNQIHNLVHNTTDSQVTPSRNNQQQ